ncbi:Leucine-rich repeat-containing protein [Artemisia annua]|uniref:Leucine-rich repeat-containing protein n=1 Tax=Artemisia annua TaxID=35608 RepID=A0A2U1QAW6_ARTAN|nr:Leucine-rich repeat-containing protein [Artemisia annua]
MVDILISGTMENNDCAKTMINAIVSETQTGEDKKPTDNVDNSTEVKQVPTVVVVNNQVPVVEVNNQVPVVEVNNQVPVDAVRDVGPSVSYIGDGDGLYVNGRNAGYYMGGAGAYSVGAYGEFYPSGILDCNGDMILFLLQPIMASSSNPSDGTLPRETILHMISSKLHSSKYFLWRNQMIPLLLYHKLMSHVDGSAAPPSATTIADNKELPNPAYTTRLPLKLLDFLLLHRSGMLSKTHIATLRLNLYTVYVINFASWSKEPLLFLILAANLRPYVISYQPLDNLLMNRTSFIAIRASKPHPSFRNLLSQAESHENFLTSLHCSTSTPPVAFVTDHSRPPYTGRLGRVSSEALTEEKLSHAKSLFSLLHVWLEEISLEVRFLIMQVALWILQFRTALAL